ncbi:hypothetical protein TrVE_jg10400 [Triparma verrucosa]|uniref:Branched-chain-amino-acid aminotransferase n=2 Tax=Triparma TaxID=722752 RepID=A0A9W7AY36_9STRA|nr:hypothetical protein TrST_g12714 [Triparma strigata]GMI09542.1 hypothetical protein TrVE_jg10400 [Triparma verrucosa]
MYLRRLSLASLIFLAALSLSVNAAAPTPTHAEPKNLDWSSFGFSLNNLKTPYMYLDQITGSSSHATFDGSGGGSGSLKSGWHNTKNPPLARTLITPHKAIELEPSSTILNYGQGLFEGIKAFRRPNNEIVIFRPSKNAERCRRGCARILIPPIPDATFVEACSEVVRYNAEFVPPTGKGALYLRPIVFGSAPKLGVAPSDEYTFCVWCSPVGNYFKTESNATGTLLSSVSPITLLVSRGYTRSCIGGVGGVKAVGNYAPVFKCQSETKEKGFNEALFVDAKEGQWIEEAGASNFFVYIPHGDRPGGTLVTPPLNNGTILAGVTRDSILTLARAELPDITVEERPINLNELGKATEAFCCGTGASITPVGDIHVPSTETEGEETIYNFWKGERRAGDVTEKLYKMLHDIMWGEDKKLEKKYADWILVVPPLPKA